MITLKDIRAAVNRQLNKTGVDINSRDVSEGYNTPSFFVQFNNVNRHGTETQIERDLIVHIYYFPTDRYEYAMEILDMQEVLEVLFDLKLRVKDRELNVGEFQTFLNDGILNATFDIDFIDARNIDWVTDDRQEHIDDHPIEQMENIFLKEE